MKKISTLFKKDKNDLGRVVNEIDPENAWVYDCGIPTRKFDGTSCAVINGELYKRYDVKRGKTAPHDALPCQEPDSITGHWPHWIKCYRLNSADKFHFEAFDKAVFEDGTYELCGPKINGNKEKLSDHVLIRHGSEVIDLKDFSFNAIKDFLSKEENDIEGIVFHAADGSGRMCKIRKSDFWIKR